MSKETGMPTTPTTGPNSKPPSTAVGLFRGRQNPVQCYWCHGWGHVYIDCATPLHFQWEEGGGDLPPI